MKEHPIIFSTDMVKAILNGGKTQARRVITPQPEWKERNPALHISDGWYWNNKESTLNGWKDKDEFVNELKQFCPYGQVGDRLWVRETWADPQGLHIPAYKADDATAWENLKWRPSIHMPRWASRILLEITEIKVERLQEISEGDVEREGTPMIAPRPSGVDINDFKYLWNKLNAKRGYGWETNPWVWVISFRRIE